MSTQTGSTPPSEHSVHFYDDDRRLLDEVSAFLSTGLLAGQSVVLIATDAHCEALKPRLEASGVDVDGACFRGRLTLLDADETLDTFMVDGMPDADLFRATVGGVVEKRLRASGPAGLRAFGEMVDVLWRRDQIDAALRLEDLWNELAAENSFSLLCAYSMGHFYGGSGAAGKASVVARHTHVFPVTSSLTAAVGEDQTAHIERLEQLAIALQAEIAERKKLESALRTALAAQKAAEAELRQAQEDLRDFFENAVEGLHWVGPDGTILWANRAEMDLLGYSPDEYIGRHIAEFHADQPVIDDILTRLSRNEKLHAYPARLRCKDGSTRRVEISSSVLWRDGKFVHTRCFTRPVKPA